VEAGKRGREEEKETSPEQEKNLKLKEGEVSYERYLFNRYSPNSRSNPSFCERNGKNNCEEQRFL
jgi:hypothetical protein